MDKSCTYIVTGCTGFVGNVLTKKLLEEGFVVKGLARSPRKAEQVFQDKKPEFVFGNISDETDVEALFRGNGPFVVIHTVAKVTIGEGSQKELQDVTVKGTENIVRACCRHNVLKFIHISSTEAIPKGLVLKEDISNYVPDPARSRKGYPRAKAEADAIVLRAVKEHGLNASILLFASVIGPGDYGNGHMSQMFIDFLEGKLPASVRGGYNDFDIRDVADVLPAILDRAAPGESYIFANRPDRIDEILNIAADHVGKKHLPALPLWCAYLGLPFLGLWAKLRKKRPLYTAAALAAIREKTDFPISKTKETFGFSPRPLSQTITDQLDFLIRTGKVKIKS